MLYRDGNSTEIVKCTTLDEDYEYFAEKVWPWIDLAAYSFVPLSIIVICNVAIVVKVWLHRHFYDLICVHVSHFVSYLVYAVVQFKVDFKGFSGHCSQGRSGHCRKQLSA